MRGLNLDHLRTFLYVIELGSFSAAAQKQGLTQPAVSQQIRSLERKFGLRLAERVGRQVHATDAGTELLIHIRAIDAVLDQAIHAMTSLAAEVTGRIRLGTGATACTYLLPRMLTTLRKRFPGLSVVVTTGNTADILRGIEANQIDIGLVTLPVAGRNFSVTPVMQDEFVAIFSAAEPDVAPHVTAEMLTTKALVLFEPGARTRQLVDDWFARSARVAKPVMALGSTEAIKEIVAAGLGCAVLPALSVTGAGHRQTLTIRPLSPPLRRELAVVMRNDKPVNRALRHVADALASLSLPPTP